MKKGIIIGIIFIIVIAVGIFLSIKDKNDPTKTNSAAQTADLYKDKSSRELALMCDVQEHLVMHIHPILKIFIDGQAQEIPANIGVEGLSGDSTHEQAKASATCLHFLHTHDASGTLHVESPVPMDYSLGDFFAVWGKTFTKDQILDSKVDDKHHIHFIVDGQENSDFENLILKDKQQIEIKYEAI